MKIKQKIELLAPAGNMEKLKIAIQYGANAVYVGTKDYSLRAQSDNFSLDGELGLAVQYAHQYQVKIYVALNIIARDSDFQGLKHTIKKIAAAGVDAVIVSDPGIFALVREEAPELEIHISTQASTSNSRTCRFWYEQGAKRIVLARELSLKDIQKIRSEIPEDLELETFVHGAMCMAWSGRCLLSAYINHRSANRGECTQPCRWKYQTDQVILREPKHPENPLILEEDKNGAYIMNSADLCMIEHIPELIEAGIQSFKIEGRTKSFFYVATVMKSYRAALDAYSENPQAYQMNQMWLDDLHKTVHRPFATGFFFNETEKSIQEMDAKIDHHETMVKEGEIVGVVRAWLPTEKLLLVEQRNKITLGENLEMVRPKGAHVQMQVEVLLDLEKNKIESTPHAKMLYYLAATEGANEGALLRRII